MLIVPIEVFEKIEHHINTQWTKSNDDGTVEVCLR